VDEENFLGDSKFIVFIAVRIRMVQLRERLHRGLVQAKRDGELSDHGRTFYRGVQTI
jgi:hypothetical protein